MAAKDVAESIGIWGKAAKKTVDILQVEKRISKILSVTQLERWVKADILLHENERNYSDSKILTDIRSVFDSGDKLFSGGAVIIHQLKIKYQDNDSMEREFFLALDTSDVQKMLKTLEKAEKKATHLISKLQKEETVYYNVGKKSI